jgi:hypothetical protein
MWGKRVDYPASSRPDNAVVAIDALTRVVGLFVGMNEIFVHMEDGWESHVVLLIWLGRAV